MPAGGTPHSPSDAGPSSCHSQLHKYPIWSMRYRCVLGRGEARTRLLHSPCLAGSASEEGREEGRNPLLWLFTQSPFFPPSLTPLQSLLVGLAALKACGTRQPDLQEKPSSFPRAMHPPQLLESSFLRFLNVEKDHGVRCGWPLSKCLAPGLWMCGLCGGSPGDPSCFAQL